MVTKGSTYGEVFSLSENQLLLKGSILRNTEWIVGIVVYSGTDTKLMQNQAESRFKQSSMEKETNKTVVRFLLVLIISSFLLGVCAIVFNQTASGSANYLPEGETGGAFFFSTFLTTICLNSSFIPVSLIVTVEFVKLIESYFISIDAEMFGLREDGSLQPC